MSFFSKAMSVATDSAMIAMTKRARELKAQGNDVIALSSGEVDEAEDKLLESMQKVLAVDDQLAAKIVEVLSLKYAR